LAGNHGQREPDRVGHEVARGQVHPASALELSDALLVDRLPAVVGLEIEELPFAVGDEPW
jgi:hypothetical protein